MLCYVMLCYVMVDGAHLNPGLNVTDVRTFLTATVEVPSEDKDRRALMNNYVTSCNT